MQAILANLPRSNELQWLLNAVGEGIVAIDADGAIHYTNKAARRLLETAPEEIQGRTLGDFFVGRSDYDSLLGSLLGGDLISTDECVLRTGAGREIHVLMTGVPVLTDHEVDGGLIVFRDITPSILLNRSLHERTNRLEMAVKLNNQINDLLQHLLTERGPDETLVTALKGALSLARADSGALAFFRPVEGEGILKYTHFVGLPESMPALEIPLSRSILQHVAKSGQAMIVEDYPAHPLAIPTFVECGASSMLGGPIMADLTLIGMVVLFRNSPPAFTDEEKRNLETLLPGLSAAIFKSHYENKLSRLATRDDLTNLWNRRAVFETLTREIDRSQRHGTPLSVILIDLDNFKDINDNYGHQAGDRVLMEAAAIMEATSRSSDTVGRSGGEEFLIILPGSDLAGCLAKAAQLWQAFQELKVEFDQFTLGCTASMGCAQLRADENLTHFYGRLDHLLYQSKHEGRNRYSAAEQP